MIIGIVVNVLEEEHQRQAKAEARAAGEPTLAELREEIRALRGLIEERQRG
jgi:voltage-gated sodium channel